MRSSQAAHDAKRSVSSVFLIGRVTLGIVTLAAPSAPRRESAATIVYRSGSVRCNSRRGGSGVTLTDAKDGVCDCCRSMVE